MDDDQSRAEAAKNILADREDRYAIFPSDIFDEYAWTMLLNLFVAFAEGNVLTEKMLLEHVHTSKTTGQRWLYQLAKDEQVEIRMAGEDVKLTTGAIRKLRGYLDTVRQR
jgi:hypothetical protein